jgi:hypothetical protein
MYHEARPPKDQWFRKNSGSFSDFVEVESKRSRVIEELDANVLIKKDPRYFFRKLTMQVSALLNMIAPISSSPASSLLASAWTRVSCGKLCVRA